jgi:hypothetical protein
MICEGLLTLVTSAPDAEDVRVFFENFNGVKEGFNSTSSDGEVTIDLTNYPTGFLNQFQEYYLTVVQASTLEPFTITVTAGTAECILATFADINPQPTDCTLI